MKNSLALIVLLSILWSCQETKKDVNRRDYKVGDKFEIDGKEYSIQDVVNYPNGNNGRLILKVDTLNTIYEKHIYFYPNSSFKNISLINPKIDTSLTLKKIDDVYMPVYYMFIGYTLKEESFYENNKHKSISIRNSILTDTTFNNITYNEDGSIKRKTKEKKVGDLWITEREKDGKTTIDTSYFWK